MQVAEYIEQIEVDGCDLAAAGARAEWGAPVPATDWVLRDLVTHVGGVHRWAADVVRSRRTTGDTPAGRAVGTGPSDEELLPWFREGLADLLAALRAAPADLDCFTFLPAPSPLAFWARRQAHETAVHRADAQRAAGIDAQFDVAFAQDGIAEIVTGFARRRSNAVDTVATLGLLASDADDWTITFGGERIEAVPSRAASPGATVTGTSGDLYQWLWNRPARVEVAGDAAVTELWRNVQVRWS